MGIGDCGGLQVTCNLSDTVFELDSMDRCVILMHMLPPQIAPSAMDSCDVSCIGFNCGMYVDDILHSLACRHKVPACLTDTNSTAGMLSDHNLHGSQCRLSVHANLHYSLC